MDKRCSSPSAAPGCTASRAGTPTASTSSSSLRRRRRRVRRGRPSGRTTSQTASAGTARRSTRGTLDFRQNLLVVRTNRRIARRVMVVPSSTAVRQAAAPYRLRTGPNDRALRQHPPLSVQKPIVECVTSRYLSARFFPVHWSTRSPQAIIPSEMPKPPTTNKSFSKACAAPNKPFEACPKYIRRPRRVNCGRLPQYTRPVCASPTACASLSCVSMCGAKQWGATVLWTMLQLVGGATSGGLIGVLQVLQGNSTGTSAGRTYPC